MFFLKKGRRGAGGLSISNKSRSVWSRFRAGRHLWLLVYPKLRSTSAAKICCRRPDRSQLPSQPERTAPACPHFRDPGHLRPGHVQRKRAPWTQRSAFGSCSASVLQDQGSGPGFDCRDSFDRQRSCGSRLALACESRWMQRMTEGWWREWGKPAID